MGLLEPNQTCSPANASSDDDYRFFETRENYFDVVAVAKL